MASIASLGVGSGLDLGNIVKQLIAAEGAPKKARFDAKEAELQAKISAMGTLKSALSEFQGSFSSLKSSSIFSKKSATSGDTNIFTATATSTAASGNYTVQVNTLAQAHTLASGAFNDTSTAVGTGTLTFEFGAWDGAAFTADATKTKTVTITDGTLQGIKDAINDAAVGVTASIINDGTGYRLVTTSSSGANNSLRVTVADNDTTNTDSLSGLSQLAYDPAAAVGAGKNMTETLAAQNASIKVNGVTVTSATNTVTGAVQGITLNLKQADAGVNYNLSVSADTDSVISAMESMVESFNAVVEAIDAIAGYDAETKTAGILIGDATVRGIGGRIRNLMSQVVGNSTTTYNSLASIGISTQQDGTLAFDSSVLTGALAAKPDEVRVLLAGGAASPPDSYINFINMPETLAAGKLRVDISQLAAQGSYIGTTGLGGAFFDLSAGSYTFQLTLDGAVTTNTLTIANANYGSGAALASEIQRLINQDSNVSVAGKSVTVSYNATTNGLELYSSKYGTTSNVQFVTASADTKATLLIGDGIGTSTAGQHVSGMIGNESATGSGRELTGDNTYNAVTLEVLGGGLGFRGNITIYNGVMDQLDDLLDSYLDSGGLIEGRNDGFSSQIDGITVQRETLQERLDQLELQYINKFSAMDALVGQLNATSNYLSNQLSGLSSLNRRK